MSARFSIILGSDQDSDGEKDDCEIISEIPCKREHSQLKRRREDPDPAGPYRLMPGGQSVVNHTYNLEPHTAGQDFINKARTPVITVAIAAVTARQKLRSDERQLIN
jgi:hypothetical protein